MIKAKGIVFGDGLMELIPDETEDKVIYLDDLREEAGSQKQEDRHSEDKICRKTAKRSGILQYRNTLIILSVIAPFVFGFLWAGVMVQHEAIYVLYWQITFAWAALVMYANKGRKRCRKGR